MFNKLILKLSMVVVAIIALSAAPATASDCGDHDSKAAVEDVVVAHTVDAESVDMPEEMPEEHAE